MRCVKLRNDWTMERDVLEERYIAGLEFTIWGRILYIAQPPISHNLSQALWKYKSRTVQVMLGHISVQVIYRIVPETIFFLRHYTDVIMGTIASQINSFTIVYSAVYSDADQRKYPSSALLAFVWGIHRRPVNSPHKGPVTREMFPFDDVIMDYIRSHSKT